MNLPITTLECNGIIFPAVKIRPDIFIVCHHFTPESVQGTFNDCIIKALCTDKGIDFLRTAPEGIPQSFTVSPKTFTVKLIVYRENKKRKLRTICEIPI